MERRHGPLPVLLLFVLGERRRRRLTRALHQPSILGGNGAALALLTAWALPDLLAVRGGRDIDGDLLGTAVIAGVVALIPLAVTDASWISDAVGVAAGLLIGLPLARLAPG